MFPVVSYCTATFFMYRLSMIHPKYRMYTGWSRMQILFCIPWLPDPVATNLIYLNAFGCLLSVHMWYGLSNYEVLHILASRSLSPFNLHSTWMHYVSDGVIHGTPALLALRLTPVYHPYLWLLPACTHVMYPYIVQGHWDPTRLYDIPIQYPAWKFVIGWTCNFIGYFFINQSIRISSLRSWI